MNGHPEFLELIAMSIDFDLTDEEFGRLSTHLARCPECRRAADELRGDATAIAAYPAPRLAPARSEQILRAALRTPRPQPRWGMLAVAAMLTTLGGGILFAGFQLINDDDATPSEPPPSFVAEASAKPSTEPGAESPEPGDGPVDGPPATPNTGDPTPTPPDLGEIDFAFPLPYTSGIGNVRVAPTTDGRLWVTFQHGRQTVVAQLDDAGRGEPWVEPDAEACEPFGVGDGSVRVLCLYNITETPEECVDVCYEPRLYAWRGPGDDLPGFPVALPSGISTAVNGGRMVGTNFIAVVSEADDEVVAQFGEYGSARVVTVGEDGSVREGAQVPAPLSCCTIGPDGVAYGSTPLEGEGTELQTRLVAFDENGMRPGWPITVDGAASHPSFGPNGQLVYASWIDEATRIVRVNPDGSAAGNPVDVGWIVEWSPDMDGPLPPLLDEDGRTWIVAQGFIYRLDAEGRVLDGFPYEPETGLLRQGGECPPGDTGCQDWTEPPRMAPRGLLYALEEAPAGMGGRITAVNPDGSVRSGWPKTLQRPGARWDNLSVGENRIAYAVAVEPEPGNESSISILAFAPNGTRQWIRTLIEP